MMILEPGVFARAMRFGKGWKMAQTFSDRVFNVLKEHPEQRYKSFEIAQLVFNRYPKECADKRAKSKQTFDSDTEFNGSSLPRSASTERSYRRSILR